MNLYPSQVEDANVLSSGHLKKVLGNTIGTGKTRTVLAACNSLECIDLIDLVIIVGSASVVYGEENWENEIKILLKDYSVANMDLVTEKRDKLYNNKGAYPNPSHLLISYSLINNDFTKLTRFIKNNKLRYALVIDEAHNVTNPKAKRTKYLRRLSENAEATYLITGTAVEKPNDLFGLDWVMGLDTFGSYDKFVTLYCKYDSSYLTIYKYGKKIRIEIKKVTGFNAEGWKVTEEWSKKYVLRRPADESKLPIQLPPIYRYVSLDGEEKKLYDELVTSRKELFQEKNLDWEELSRLFKEYRNITRKKKTEELLNFLTLVVDSRTPVIFSPSRKTIEHLEVVLKENGYTTGLFTGVQKDSLVGLGKDYQILLMTQAGKEGVNGMQRANAMLFFDYPFTAKEYEQLVGRVRRVGQESTDVLVAHLHCKKTVDDKMKKRLEDGSLSLDKTREFSEKEWLELFT